MNQTLDSVLDHLYSEFSDEATTVADILAAIVEDYDPDMPSPEFLAARLANLIYYAQEAKTMLVPAEPPHNIP